MVYRVKNGNYGKGNSSLRTLLMLATPAVSAWNKYLLADGMAHCPDPTHGEVF